MKANLKSANKAIVLNSEFANYADFVVAQAKHESANFTSNVYKANNNPFGMKVPSQRKFLGTRGTPANDGGYYARYESDSVAFEDLLLWMRARKFPTNLETVEDYAEALKARGYFGDTLYNYTNALKRWLN